MKKSNLLNSLILAALAIPGLVMAEDSPFSGNVSLTSDYLFRGATQTNHRGAIQGGFDYAHASGAYAGAWASNISWLTDTAAYTDGASLELDTYAGYGGSISDDVSYDVGFLRYNYSGNYVPGTISANTNEIYGSVGWKWVKAKYSRSMGDLFGFADSKGSGYLDLSGSYDIEAAGISVGAHYGKQTVANNSAADYADYNVSVSKDFSGYSLGLMLSKTDMTGDKARAVVSVSHSM